MLVYLELYPAIPGESAFLEVEPDCTIENLITLYQEAKNLDPETSMVILNRRNRAIPRKNTLKQLRVSNGQKLRIAYKDGVNKKRMFSRWLIISFLTVAALCVLLLLIFFSFKTGTKLLKGQSSGFAADEDLLFRRDKNLWCYNSTNSTTNKKKYGIIMDGGSSKTCSVSYSWDEEKYKGTGCVLEKDHCCAKGGLTGSDPLNHIKRVMVCIRRLTNNTFFGNNTKSPVFFAATAAMRIQYIIDSSRAADVLNKMKKYLQKTNLSIRNEGILSGQKEALYGWIGSNDLRNIFKDDDLEEKKTYGIVDLRGASTQIAFEVSAANKNDYPADIKSTKLYGKNYEVFSRGDLCFGRERAEERYRSFLIKDVQKTEVEDPCLPSNFTFKQKGAEIFLGVCSYNSRFTEAMGKKPEILNDVYKFKGSSNPSYCRGNISKILDEENCKRSAFKECFKKITVPEKTKFLAYSSYLLIMKQLNLAESNMEKFVEAANNFCSNDFKALNKYTDIPPKYRIKLCFNSLYMYELLANGYGFARNTWDNIKFVGEDDEQDLTWTLGHMIDATNDPSLR